MLHLGMQRIKLACGAGATPGELNRNALAALRDVDLCSHVHVSERESLFNQPAKKQNDGAPHRDIAAS